ncbi:MAG: DUF1476 domain-containing protein [Alphaproteobacteria bacterium]|nr:DUF1476 domain-containing protein [Alphaproteobacteria bacterium]
MAQFDDRKKAFEDKFAHDTELQFKAGARRNKLLGLWAAEQMGLTGDAAKSYATSVIESDFEEAGDEDVFKKVMADLKAKKVDISDHRLRKRMDELLAEAREQLMKE